MNRRADTAPETLSGIHENAPMPLTDTASLWLPDTRRSCRRHQVEAMKQSTQLTASTASRPMNGPQAPCSTSNGSWNAAPNGVHANTAAGAAKVSMLNVTASIEAFSVMLGT